MRKSNLATIKIYLIKKKNIVKTRLLQSYLYFLLAVDYRVNSIDKKN